MIFSSHDIVSLLVFALAAVIAIVLHECAHGLVAKWNGDYTAQYHGRITLNPVKHFDLFGFIMLVTVGFGFAKPVPVNPNNFRRRRKGIFLVSIAGVVTNLILAFIASGFCILIERFTGVDAQYPNEFMYIITLVFRSFFQVLTLINVYLVIFNLLPIFPLDGHRVLESITGPMNKVTKFLRDIGPFILIILVLLGALMGFLTRLIGHLPEWMDPLGYLIKTVGGGFANCFFNFWRFVMGLWGNIVW